MDRVPGLCPFEAKLWALATSTDSYFRLIVITSLCVVLTACGRSEGDRGINENVANSEETFQEPPGDQNLVGKCAVDSDSGAFIGKVLGLGQDPHSGDSAYVVQLETAPTDTAYVGMGTRIVACDSISTQMKK